MAGPLDVLSATTIANYALGAVDGVTLHNPMLKAMRDKADWEYDVGGISLSGSLEAGFDRPIISAPGQDLTPNLRPSNRYAMWTQVWGEISGVKTVDNGMLRRNNGKQALVKLRDKEIPAMFKGMLDKQDGLLHQFLNQDIANPTQYSGAVTGLPFAGLPSFLLKPTFAGLLGFNGLATYTGVAVVAADKEAVAPAGTNYAGLSLAPTSIAVDNPVVDAWTPCLVNATSTAWNGVASASGAILLFLQHMANRSRRFSSTDPSMRPDADYGAWLSLDYFQFLGAKIAALQSIMLTGKSGPATTDVATGTNSEYLDHAGFRWRWDERMPALCAYLITWSQLMVKMQTLFAGIEGNGNPLGKSGEDAGLIESAVTYDPVRRGWIATGTLPGQFQAASPRYFSRAGAYA